MRYLIVFALLLISCSQNKDSAISVADFLEFINVEPKQYPLGSLSVFSLTLNIILEVNFSILFTLLANLNFADKTIYLLGYFLINEFL